MRQAPWPVQRKPARAGTRQAAMCGNVAAYLFRPPTGLADGLALKELALPPSRGEIRPDYWFPRSGRGPCKATPRFGVIGRLASLRCRYCPRYRTAKPLVPQFRRRASCSSVNFAADLVDAAPPDRLPPLELGPGGRRGQDNVAA